MPFLGWRLERCTMRGNAATAPVFDAVRRSERCPWPSRLPCERNRHNSHDRSAVHRLADVRCSHAELTQALQGAGGRCAVRQAIGPMAVVLVRSETDLRINAAHGWFVPRCRRSGKPRRRSGQSPPRPVLRRAWMTADRRAAPTIGGKSDRRSGSTYPGPSVCTTKRILLLAFSTTCSRAVSLSTVQSRKECAIACDTR